MPSLACFITAYYEASAGGIVCTFFYTRDFPPPSFTIALLVQSATSAWPLIKVVLWWDKLQLIFGLIAHSLRTLPWSEQTQEGRCPDIEYWDHNDFSICFLKVRVCACDVWTWLGGNSLSSPTPHLVPYHWNSLLWRTVADLLAKVSMWSGFSHNLSRRQMHRHTLIYTEQADTYKYTAP